MRFSLSVHFLGWWLAGQMWVSRGALYSNPSITVRPSETVTLGGNATIHCRSKHHTQMEFHLQKKNSSSFKTWRKKVAEQNEAVFPIVSATQSDAGIYRCIYCFSSNGNCREWSDYSDTININITVYPRPSISVSPSELVTRGGKATIQCNHEQYKEEALFYLQKGGYTPTYEVKQTQWHRIALPIYYVTRSYGGIYRCKYCISHLCSYFSDRVCLNITDPKLSKPTIMLRPSKEVVEGLNVTIECQGPEKGLNFTLNKPRDQRAFQMTAPDTSATEFPLPGVRLEDKGNYSCRYHSRRNAFVWSLPSDPVELVVIERPMTIIWASIAAGFLLLVLLLLFLAFILYRKRRKGSTANRRTQSLSTKEANMTLKPEPEEDTEGVSYAILHHHSLKTKLAAVPDATPESCIYAAVAENRSREGQ